MDEGSPIGDGNVDRLPDVARTWTETEPITASSGRGWNGSIAGRGAGVAWDGVAAGTVACDETASAAGSGPVVPDGANVPAKPTHAIATIPASAISQRRPRPVHGNRGA